MIDMKNAIHPVAVFDGPAPGERSARGYTSDGRRVAVSLDARVPRIVDAALAPYGLRVNRCAAGVDVAPEEGA